MVVGAKGCPSGIPFSLLCQDSLWLLASDIPQAVPCQGWLVIGSNWLQISAGLTSHFISEASLGGGTWEFPGVRFRHSPCSICI